MGAVVEYASCTGVSGRAAIAMVRGERGREEEERGIGGEEERRGRREERRGEERRGKGEIKRGGLIVGMVCTR